MLRVLSEAMKHSWRPQQDPAIVAHVGARRPLDRDELSRIDRMPLRSGGFVLLFTLTCVIAVIGAVTAGVRATWPVEPDGLGYVLVVGAVLLVIGELFPIQVA